MGDSFRVSQPAIASGWYRKSLLLTKETASRAGGDVRYWVADADEELAAVLTARKDAVERLHLLQDANTIWKGLVSASNGRPQDRASLMRSYCTLSDAELRSNYLARARQYADMSVPFFDEFKLTSPSLLVLRDVSFCYQSLGNVQRRVSVDHAFSSEERRAAAANARQWYLTSADAWTEWNRRGAATPESEAQRHQVEYLLQAR